MRSNKENPEGIINVVELPVDVLLDVEKDEKDYKKVAEDVFNGIDTVTDVNATEILENDIEGVTVVCNVTIEIQTRVKKSDIQIVKEASNVLSRHSTQIKPHNDGEVVDSFPV